MIVVFDLEQFKNFHSCFAVNKDTGEEFYFELSPYRDDRISYFEWLKTIKGMIGFNNLSYDYPLLDFFIRNNDIETQKLIKLMYIEGQRIINNDYSEIKKPLIRQLDLYRICHFDNKAKITSLKDIQFALKWYKIQDLPFKFNSILSKDECAEVEKYNRNDTLSTLAFYRELADKIELRKQLSKEYNIDCLNWNDSKIGEQILINDVAKSLKVHPSRFKSFYKGEKININECFVEYNIINEEIQKQKDRFATKSLTNEEFKGNISDRVVIDGFPFDFGAGGIHGCKQSQYVAADDKYDIYSSDVSSYYPNLAIVFAFFIKQFGKHFLKVLKDLYEKKQWAKKHGFKTTLAAVKLALVSIFGKSNDKWSKLFDPTYFLKTTINGQLLLADLHASLIKQGFKPLLLNTDGVEFLVPKSQKHIYLNICQDWMNKTNLVLEHDQYSKLAIMNVNNYIGQFTNGKIKKKGLFETEKDWHKDHSFKIVSLALEKYFINGIRPEEFIKNHDNIFDFCGRVKSNAGYQIEYHIIIDNELNIENLQKTNRVFLSTTGGYLYKTKDDRKNGVFVQQKVTLFNDYYELPFDQYNVNYKWYIREVYKIIDEIEPKQLTLF